LEERGNRVAATGIESAIRLRRVHNLASSEQSVQFVPAAGHIPIPLHLLLQELRLPLQLDHVLFDRGMYQLHQDFSC
jgi:hypothetical protein